MHHANIHVAFMIWDALYSDQNVPTTATPLKTGVMKLRQNGAAIRKCGSPDVILEGKKGERRVVQPAEREREREGEGEREGGE